MAFGGYRGAPGNSGAALDTTSKPTPGLWAEVDSAPKGTWVESYADFADLPTIPTLTTEIAWGNYRVFGSSGATAFGKAADEGGSVNFIEATDNEGASIGQNRFPFKIIQGAGEMIFEARFKRDEITGTWGLLCGLYGEFAITTTRSVLTAIAPIAAAGTLVDSNFVGFQNLESTPSVLSTVYKADGVTQVNVLTAAKTLVADTYVKAGMVFNRDEDNILRFYIDGVESSAYKSIPSAAGTDFPNDLRMGWVFAMLNGATAACNTTLDWIRCAQKRTS